MKRLRWYDYITINIFWLGLNIRNTAIGSYFMPYLVGLFVPETVKNTALGALRSAGLIIAMLVQPAAGLISDRSLSRFGRRRPYILIGAIFDCVFLAAIALSWNYLALLIAVLLIQVSSNVSHGPLQGLIPDLVPEDQRGRASAVKSVMELLPIILVGLTIAKLVGAGHLDWAIFATGASLLTVTLITMLLCEGNSAPGKAGDSLLAAHAACPGDAGRYRHRRGGRPGRGDADRGVGGLDHSASDGRAFCLVYRWQVEHCRGHDHRSGGRGFHDCGCCGGSVGRRAGHPGSGCPPQGLFHLVDRQPADVPGGCHLHPGLHFLFCDVCFQDHR